MTEPILSYHQADSIKLLCEINLKKLHSAPQERDRFAINGINGVIPKPPNFDSPIFQ